MLRRKLHLFAIALFGLAACATTAPPAALAPPTPPPPPGPSDDGIDEPESGYWERTGPGLWLYDLGAGFPASLQLGVNDVGGRGILRVALPPGATQATVTALAVGYTRDATEDGSADPSASGEATWTFYADDHGAPGAELGHVDVTVDAATVPPLDEGGEPMSHVVPGIEVGPVFWLAFTVRSGQPRVGGMYVNRGPEDIEFRDLFYQPTRTSPLDNPVNARPYVALTFAGLGR
ncbi:MAG: hypothetical protein EP329_00755 [Deltaproteobacteria bacterium]|nr:MAG: hypothetical protein EP329_00755 [Deltaproteobacteria bacterium]